MESRPRSRRPVTYGSTAKNQSQSIRNAHASTVGPNSNRSRRLAEGDKAKNPHQSLNDASDTNIYDIPSSDEGDRQIITRVKRRRFGTNRHFILPKDPVDSQRDTSNGANAKSNITSGTKRTTVSHGPDTTSSPPRNITQEGRWPSRYKGGAHSPGQPLQVAAPTKPSKDIETIRRPDDDLPKNPDTRQRNLQSMPPKSPSPTMPVVESGTPGRRRLVDSLGIKEQSADGSSSDILGDCQLSPPAVPATPTRQEELISSRVLGEDQREGEGLNHDPTVTISPHLRGSRVTYARQRSFLDDLLMETEALHSNLPLSGHDPLAQITHGDANNGVRSRVIIEEPANEDGTVRSIHELRQAGGNARYRAAVDSIFEDLEDFQISSSGRCNAFVQLCNKLLDSKLASQFLECNFDKRLVDLFTRDLDLASSSLVLCAYNLCFLGRPIPYMLATTAWPKLLYLATTLLDAQDDISTTTRQPQQKITKATQISIQNIVPQIRSTLLPDTMNKLSPCLLILKSLKITLSAIQEKGENPASLPVPLLKQMVNLMLSTSSAHEKAPSSTIEPEYLQILAIGLSILEAHTASGQSLQPEQRDVLSSLPSLCGLLSKKNECSANTTSRQIQALYIRVILNVTNSHPVLCDNFATSSIIDELAEVTIGHFAALSGDTLAQDGNDESLDTVILALGALINLTEQSETSRVIFLHPGTTGKPLLGRLLSLFLSHVDSTSEAHSVPEVHHNVAVGYLAVLLLALCLDSSARLEVKKSLHSKGLSLIMSIADEFLQYHRRIEHEQQPLPVQGEAGEFPVRLQDLITQIQHSES